MKKIIILIVAFATISCSSQKGKISDDFDFGKTENGVYKNNYFNLEINFNPGWVVQDKEQMNLLKEAGSKMVAGEDKYLSKAIKAAYVNTAYLLSIFKHPIGAAVDFNPSFMVIAENVENFPGVKIGSDYLFHAKKLLEQSQMDYYFEKDIYEKKIGNSTYYVLEAKFDYLGQTLRQDYLSSVEKGFSLSYVASFATDEQREELYEILDNIKN